MNRCWICREQKSTAINIPYSSFSVCEECYNSFNGKIRQCAGYDGRECSSPVLGDEVTDGMIRCQECEEHYQEENLDMCVGE